MEWMRDVIERQRNVVFPDTAKNEARFWRNLYMGRTGLSGIQIAGLVIIAGALLLVVFIIPAVRFTRGLSLLDRVALLSLDWLVPVLILAAFLAVFRLVNREKTGR